jgi:predicted MFS family arabinose efflux permease
VNALAAYRDLLANRPLTKLLTGEFVSAIGDWLYIVALLVVIYGETGDPLVLGLFGAARIVPYVLLSVPAGVLADRVDRRMILLVTDLARGACMLAMAWVVAMDGPVLVLVVLSIVAACFSTFFYPAIGAYIPNLARDERQLGPANSAWASLDNLGFVVGPVLGGLLLAAGGTVFAFLINALTFVIIAAVLWTLPSSRNVAPAAEATPAETPTATAPTSEVIPATPGPRSNGVALAGIATLRFVDYAIYGGIGMLTVVFATDILKAGEAATGYLSAAIGVGGVIGAIVSGLLVLRRSLRLPVIAGSIVIAGGAALLGLSQSLVVAMVAIAVACAGHLVLEVLAATLLQRVTTDAVRGRAVGTMVSIDTIAEATGSLLFPVLVVSVGAVATMATAGLLMLGATVAGLALIGNAVTRAASPFEAIVARVARLPLFAGVPSAALEATLGRLRAEPVVAGQAVVRQGEPADRFYIIESGTFVVRQVGADGAEHELRRLGPDDVFGELGLLTEAPRSATVQAVSDGVVLALDGADFLALVGGRTTVRGRLLGLYEGPTGPAAA